MVFLLCSSHIVILLSPSRFKTPFFRTQFRAKTFVSFPSNSNQWKVKKIRIQCASVSSEGEAHDWRKWVPKNVNFGADKVLKSIAGATSSPICQFISSPSTVLHDVDPRIKLVWLLVLVFLPAWSHIYMRFGIVLSLALLSSWVLPKNVWMDQLGRVTLLSLFLFVVLGLTADTVLFSVSSRTPPSSLTGIPSIPLSFKGYSYRLFKFGPLQMTRKGLSLASTSACLTFTVFQSASLCLSTTPPEQLASALRWFLLPLAHIGVPVDEIVLTLLLSLRFINLIFDEVRNVALGILSRRINWQDLTLLEKIDVFVMYIRRIFKNIFSHAEQISQAMIVRGFQGDSNRHKIHFRPSSITIPNFVSLLALFGVIGATRWSGSFLV
ncbi:protein ABCI12, chloroplastic [Amaranthus tricolor]|uniref:protein ABCI12, chloroplastic n=1 Tax=Amaranthus tricolor TaxID=29722 RepID=UPI002589FBF1|nr:protein ABCI12, chloroplastic [Amaranthus tricolor]